MQLTLSTMYIYLLLKLNVDTCLFHSNETSVMKEVKPPPPSPPLALPFPKSNRRRKGEEKGRRRGGKDHYPNLSQVCLNPQSALPSFPDRLPSLPSSCMNSQVVSHFLHSTSSSITNKRRKGYQEKGSERGNYQLLLHTETSKKKLRPPPPTLGYFFPHFRKRKKQS